MRRVNEAVREVLSARIAEGLNDPRIGFVTLTSVDTSPDLRHARVYVSVLGDDAERAETLAGLASAHGLLQQAHRPRAANETDTDARVRLRRVDRPRDADHRAAGRRMSIATGHEEVLAELRSSDKLLLTTHENPDGDALGSLLAMHWILEQLGKDSLMFMSPDEFPLPWEYRQLDLRAAWSALRPTTWPSARSSSSTAATSTACRSTSSRPTGCTSSTSTTTTTTRASARSTWWCPRPRAPPRSSGTSPRSWAWSITPRDRRRALHRPRHRHRQVHVREHHAGGAPDGGRADRGRAWSRTRSTGASTRTCPSAGCSCSQRALARVERHDDGAITIAHLTKQRLRGDGRARRPTPRAWSTTCAPSRAPPWPCWCGSCSPTTATGMRKVSLRATDGRVDVSRIARAFGGGGHPQAAGFSTELPTRELVETLRAQVREQLDATRAAPDGRASCSTPKPAGVTSHDVVAGCAASLPRGDEGRPRGHARPVRHRAAARAGGRATRAQRFLMALPKTYRAVARLGWTSDTGDRDGELVETGRVPERLGSRPASSCSARPPTRR